MGAQPTKVRSSLEGLRGAPIEVWNKTEGRWIKAVVGAPQDVREQPPDNTAVLVLYKEAVRGRTDAYKWIKQEDIPQLIRARPESKQQAGMLDSMRESFGTMFDNRSSFDARLAPQSFDARLAPQKSMGMESVASMQSIPVERPQAQQQAGVMNSVIAAVGLQRPSASFASTVDQDSLGHRGNMPRMASMASTIPEDHVGFMGSMMASAMPPKQGQQYNPNIHTTPTMRSQMGNPMASHMQSQTSSHMQSQTGGMMSSQMAQQANAGVMASLMGMGPATGSAMGSHYAGSLPASMVLEENRSPNRTPMASAIGGNAFGSVAGSAAGSAAGKAPTAPGPMSSMMSSMFSMPQGATRSL
jgi:hypothetical protein